MIRWLRKVIHPGWIAVFFLFPCLIIEGGYRFLIWRDIIDAEYVISEMTDLYLFFLCTATLFYGIYRFLAYHPNFRPIYRQWLQSIPWNGSSPLPWRPIQFVRQDLVVLALPLIAMLQFTWFAPLVVAFFFLNAYVVAMASTFTRIELRPYLYTILFGCGCYVLLFAEHIALGRYSPFPDIQFWAGLGVAACLYGVASLGLKRTFQNFQQWGLDEDQQQFKITSRNKDRTVKTTDKQIFSLLGRLSPQVEEPLPGRGERFILALLAGWWLFVLQVPETDRNGLNFIISAVALVTSLIRIVGYVNGFAPPISCLGRLLTGRWIIPKFDQIFVAPLGILLLWFFLPSLLASVGMPFQVIYPITLTAIISAALQIGPSYKSWALTGNHRIVQRIETKMQPR